MTKPLCLLLVLSLTGCTTLHNLGKINRVLPQVEEMMALKNERDTNAKITIEVMTICGEDKAELASLQVYANQLGWQIYSEPVGGKCLGISYDGVDK